MRLFAYDVETFQNFFSVVFFDLNSDANLLEVSKAGFSHPDIQVFVFAPQFGMDDREQLKEFLNDEITLVGYNNNMFDSPVMDFAIWEADNPFKIFEMGQSLIRRLNGGEFFAYVNNNELDQIDLMKMMAFDALGVSLKQIAINLKWHRIQDLPLPYNAVVKENDLPMVIDYNVNDVLITSKLYRELSEELGMREELSESYGIDFRSASDSKMANLILERIYSDESGLDVEDFRHLRTDRKLVWLGSCVGKNIRFQTETLQSLLTEIRETVVVRENNFAFKEHIVFGGTEYDIGVGGLHSVDNACIFETTDTHIIRDADVSSYYPNIMLQNNIHPAHLTMTFIRILDKVTRERIQAKHAGDKTKANGLKITINSIFGKLGSETFWLQDAKAMLSVTLSGQLYLLMLIEALHLRGIRTISANTDGIVCRIPVELEDVYYETCKEWQFLTGFELEYTDYSRDIRADVNNYITIKPNGETKEKGRFVTKIGLKKGYRYPIVPQAIYSYFVNGIPVMDTLTNSNDILDFCISQKSSSKFKMEIVSPDYREIPEKSEEFLTSMGWNKLSDERWTDVYADSGGMYAVSYDKAYEYATQKFASEHGYVEKLQKTNRFYVRQDGTGGGDLQKRNPDDNSTIGLYVAQEVTILNDYDENIPMEEYQVDYNFYYDECMKYIEDIEAGEFSFEMVDEKLGEQEQDEFEGDYPSEDEIKILPPKFRKSGGSYRYDPKDRVIYRGLSTINFFTDDSAQPLYDIRKMEFVNFLDFLVFVTESEEVKINSRQMEMLIKLNFFEEFGKNWKLLKFWDEFKSGKSRYSKNHKETTKAKRVALLMDIWNNIPDKSLPIPEQINAELEILGFVQSTFNVPKRTVYVLDVVNEEYRKKAGWSAVLHVYGLTTGKSGEVRVQRKTMNMYPIERGMFLNYSQAETREAVRKVDGEFVPIPDKYNYWIYEYETRRFN